MRRNVVLTIAVVASAAVGLVAPAPAANDVCVRATAAAVGCEPPRLPVLLAKVEPRTLPKRSLAPASFEVGVRSTAAAGARPPALGEFGIGLDKNLSIDPEGLPVCSLRKLETADDARARRSCREAIVGAGLAWGATGATEPAELLELPLTLFNGGVREGIARILVRGSAAAVQPGPLLMVMRLEKARPAGRFGLAGTMKVPEIAQGRASLFALRLRMKRRFVDAGVERSFVSARCFDGQLQIAMTVRYVDGPSFKGGLLRTCLARG